MINDTLHDGTAMAKFTAMLKAQGVKPEVADRLCAKDTDVMEILPKAKYRTEMKNAYSGICHGALRRGIQWRRVTVCMHSLGRVWGI